MTAGRTDPVGSGASHYSLGMLALFLFLPVRAAIPEVTTDDAGVVRASVVVSATPSEALALLRDPEAMHRLSQDGSTLASTPDGSCFRIDYALDTAVGDVAYTGRGCPTATGFETKLVKSESFRSMTSVWTVREVPAGTEVSYVYQADVALPVPGFIVRRSTQSAITKVITKVAAALES